MTVITYLLCLSGLSKMLNGLNGSTKCCAAETERVNCCNKRHGAERNLLAQQLELLAGHQEVVAYLEFGLF